MYDIFMGGAIGTEEVRYRFLSNLHRMLIALCYGLVLLLSQGCNASKPSTVQINNPPSLNIQNDRITNPPESHYEIPASLRFERIDVSDGLSSNAVRKIFQDQTGYLWIGTQDGLNRYDGYSYQLFRNDPNSPESLRDNFIETIHQDRSGVLWVGTQSGWLERFDPDTNSFIHFQLGSRILSIQEDDLGRLWVGTHLPGLILFDVASGDADIVIEGVDFRSIIVASGGKVWAASPSVGLHVIDPVTLSWEQVPINDQIMHIVQIQENEAWLVTQEGKILQFDPRSNTVENAKELIDSSVIGSEWITDIHVDDHERIWIGTGNMGLVTIDLVSGKTRYNQHDQLDVFSLNNNHVVSVLVDNTGVLWIGNEFGGLNKTILNAFDFGYTFHQASNPNSLPEGIVTSFAEEEDGTLWIGTLGGLSAWKREADTWENYLEMDGEVLRVRSLYIDSEEQLWIGSEQGVYQLTLNKEELIHYDLPVVMWMMEDSAGNFWMATKAGLYHFYPDEGNLKLIKKGISWKIMIVEDSESKIWVGSSGDGLDVFNPATDQWVHYEQEDELPGSISGNFIETIHQDRTGVIWIGTNNGLSKYDPDLDKFSNYYVSDGLPHNYVVGILESSNGKLWLSTLGGLSQFDPQNEIFENYYFNSGLQGDTFWRNAYFKNEANELFFGGLNGFNVFDPGEIRSNTIPPRIVMRSVNLFNQPYLINMDKGDRIELAYNENYLSFDFAALDFSDPEKNQFAYMMEDIDSDWIISGNRNHADYPGLDPGQYRFWVTGSNNDGIWNEEGVWIDIIINPPFWMTWWFRTILIVLMISLVMAAYFFRVKQLAARNVELESEVEVRTQELKLEMDQRAKAEQALLEKEKSQAVQNERNRLARELHDAVTQSLFSASLLADAIPGAYKEDADEAERLMDDLRGLNIGALAEMRTLLLELRPAVLTEMKMSDLLRQLADAARAREDIQFELKINEDRKPPAVVQIAFYRVAQEALNNIIKYAQATMVEICYTCQVSGEHDSLVVELIMHDDGAGFDPAEVSPENMGIKIMTERAEEIGGEFQLSSVIGKGTSVRLLWTDHKGRGVADAE